jgi:hypothetical protein
MASRNSKNLLAAAKSTTPALMTYQSTAKNTLSIPCSAQSTNLSEKSSKNTKNIGQNRDSSGHHQVSEVCNQYLFLHIKDNDIRNQS